MFHLMSYEGGQIEPDDDMSGSQCRWSNLKEMTNESMEVIVPKKKWIVRRAIGLYSQQWTSLPEEMNAMAPIVNLSRQGLANPAWCDTRLFVWL